MADEKEDVDGLLNSLHQSDAWKGYFNGFTISHSTSDFVFIFKHNANPFAFFNTSPVVAKAVSKVLAQLVEDYEKKNETTIPEMPGLTLST